ncbi:unnamed protein product [Lactuca saligna]|uniref:Uncharacterized protein n=1 Tax=Lactuca saligna TaxID=75948 RepID=A0AA35ZSY6_LACSI|nr:unnamed protein product [Lactuca saligna]
MNMHWKLNRQFPFPILVVMALLTTLCSIDCIKGFQFSNSPLNHTSYRLQSRGFGYWLNFDMKRPKLDTASAAVAPQDVELEESDDIDVVEIDVKIEGEEEDVKMEKKGGLRFGSFLLDFQLVKMVGKGRNVISAKQTYHSLFFQSQVVLFQ